MKNLRKPVALLLCLIMALCVAGSAYAASSPGDVPGQEIRTTSPATTAADEVPDPPSDLPVSTGLRIGTLNQYVMRYDSSRYDGELGGVVMTFKLSDAGKIEALLSYCRPAYWLSESLEIVKNPADTDDYAEAQAKMNVQDILNDLLLNAGGGPDYRYVKQSELIATAEEVLKSEEYQKLAEALAPLQALEKTDVRSLMTTFTDGELAEICDNLHEAVYGEWHLRLEWLDAMEFSLLLPATGVDGVTGTTSTPAQ